MNQAELTAAVAERAGLTKADAGKAVEALVGTITEALHAGRRGPHLRFRQLRDFRARRASGPQSPDRRGDHDRSLESR